MLAWSVERRTREFGVRIALGANRAHVLRLVLGQAVVLTGIGIVAGLGVALAGSRGLAELFYEISPTDPLTLAGAVALLAAVGIGGGLLASRRALSVDPAIALRDEDELQSPRPTLRAIRSVRCLIPESSAADMTYG